MSDAPPFLASAVGRRGFVAGAVAIAVVGKMGVGRAGAMTLGGGAVEDDLIYGMIGRLRAKPGQREALAALLTSGSDAMPGCLSYVVAEDLADADALWVTEVWESKEAHQASLSLPSVREAIGQGRPLIASFDSIAQTRPISGARR